MLFKCFSKLFNSCYGENKPDRVVFFQLVLINKSKPYTLIIIQFPRIQF